MPDCPLIRNHLQFNIGDGNFIAPCCNYDTSFMDGESFYQYEDYKNSMFRAELINNMKGDGWDAGCHRCKSAENIHGVSYRLRQLSNQENIYTLGITDDKIRFLEISISDLCNLSCRICSPKFSTTWQKLYNKDPVGFSSFKTQCDDSNDVLSYLKNKLDEVDLTELRKLKLLGGEPMYPGVFDVLIDYLQSRKIDISKIYLTTNTNGSFFPKESVLGYLSQFREVGLVLSLDGIGKTFEYGREGSVWENTSKVIRKWVQLSGQYNIDRFNISAHCVVNVYTLHNIKILEEYLKSFQHTFWPKYYTNKRTAENYFSDSSGTHFLPYNFKINYNGYIQPSHIHISALPQEYINEIKDDVNGIFIDNLYDFDKEAFERFKDYTKLMDKNTGKHMKDYIPKLAKYVYD